MGPRVRGDDRSHASQTHHLRRDRRHHELLVPARRVASAGLCAPGRRARLARDRHRRSQHAGRRGACILRAEQSRSQGQAKAADRVAPRLHRRHARCPDLPARPRGSTVGCASCSARASCAPRRANAISPLPISTEFAAGQLLVLMPPYRLDAKILTETLRKLSKLSSDGVWLGASFAYRGDDLRRLARLQQIADTVKRAADRDQRRALSCAGAACAAGRSDLHPREDNDREGRTQASSPMPSGI